MSKKSKTALKFDWRKLKVKILGNRYDLSLVLCGPTLIKSLNKRFRGKDAPTDVLAFPLSETEGEIFLCPKMVKVKAQIFGEESEIYMRRLFIHGLLHLKGMRHGSKMESQEEKILNNK